MIADIQTGQDEIVRSLPIDALPTSANGRPPRPFQIVSLWEMIEFDAREFYAMLNWLIAVKDDLEQRGNPELTEKEKEAIVERADTVAATCGQYEINVSYYTRRIGHKISQGASFKPSMASVVNELRHCIIKELEERKFMFIPKGESEYYGQEELFGPEVKKKFPQANEEITIAGNCYATGNYTASVFHLMRAAEIGARHIIKKLESSKHLVNSKGVKVPVELCDWHTLIQAMEKGVADLSAGIGTSKYKKRKHEHFSHALATFRHFKNAWRNHVSHTRELYKPGKAKDVMENTRQFMQHLASGF